MRWIRRLLLTCVAMGCVVWPIASARANPVSTWTQPTAMAIKNVISSYTPARYHTTAVENLDCLDATYPIQGSNDTVTGCFIQTAFGQLEVEDTFMVFAGGKDTALPVYPFSPGQVLLGWPGSDTVLAMSTQSNGGMTAAIYRHFSASLGNERNALGQITAKRVVAAPDFTLTDGAGRPILFNPNAITFSEQGGWLVGETLSNHFVRINLATLREVTFGASFYSDSGSPGANESELGITNDGRYATVVNTAANSFELYDLASCASGTCDSYNYWSFVDHQLPAHSFISHLRFLNENLLEFNITQGLQTSSYLLAPSNSIGSALQYLGLGDSYTSGEGAGNYLPGTDTSSNRCHLSSDAYPNLLAHTLFSSSTTKSVACSGAQIQDIVAGDPAKYRGQVGDTPLGSRSDDQVNGLLATFNPGYLPQKSFVAEYQPALMTLGVGGNDIGFHDIVEECASLHLRGGNNCYARYEDRLELAQLIDKQVPRLTRLYTALKRENPLGQLYVIGYPSTIVQGDCADNVHLNSQEIALMESLTHHLNAAISEAARQAGVSYVDITDALNGYRLCEVDSAHSAVNGLTFGHDTGPSIGNTTLNVISNGSYHPTAFGQQLMEAAILRQSHSFTAPSASLGSYTLATTDTTALVTGQKTGRQIVQLYFAPSLTSAAIPGKRVALQIAGASAGLSPNTVYDVHLDGSTGPIIASTQTDVDSAIGTGVDVPVGTAPGVHTIDIVGLTQSGDTTDIRVAITVAEMEPMQVDSLITSTTPTEPPLTLSGLAGGAGIVLGASRINSESTTANPQSGQVLHLARRPSVEPVAVQIPLRYVTWLPYCILGSLFWSCALIAHRFTRHIH